MTAPAVGADEAASTGRATGPGPDAVRPDAPGGHRRRGVFELLLLAVLYGAYTITRNQFGSASGDPAVAYANALRVIDWERAMGIYHELALQEAALRWSTGIRASNLFYGTFHFVAPAVVLVALWRRRPEAYPMRRTALALTTVLALVGFSLFPLMPPRLLCDCPHGSGVDHGYVDTLAVHGGLWSFDSDEMAAVSNQYAAMPSLHFGWALWCALAAQVLLRRRWTRVAAFAYPLLTLVTIVITGNHFLLDAVGGAAVVAAGWALAVALDAATTRRRSLGPTPTRAVTTSPSGYRGI